MDFDSLDVETSVVTDTGIRNHRRRHRGSSKKPTNQKKRPSSSVVPHAPTPSSDTTSIEDKFSQFKRHMNFYVQKNLINSWMADEKRYLRGVVSFLTRVTQEGRNIFQEDENLFQVRSLLHEYSKALSNNDFAMVMNVDALQGSIKELKMAENLQKSLFEKIHFEFIKKPAFMPRRASRLPQLEYF
jgi:hypothetical protein